MTTEKNVPSPAIRVANPTVELPVASQRKVLALRAARTVIATDNNGIGTLFGSSKVPDAMGVDDLITIADYILEQPDVSLPDESAPEPEKQSVFGNLVPESVFGNLTATSDMYPDGSVGPIRTEVTEKLGLVLTPDVSDEQIEEMLPGARIRKVPAEVTVTEANPGGLSDEAIAKMRQSQDERLSTSTMWEIGIPDFRESKPPLDAETFQISGTDNTDWWVIARDRPMMTIFDEEEIDAAVSGWQGLTSRRGNPVRGITNGTLHSRQVYDAFIEAWVYYSHDGSL